MKQALIRHATREARVIPILLRPAYLEGSSFSYLQALPRSSKPVTRYRDRDEAFQEILAELHIVIYELIQQIGEVCEKRANRDTY